MVFNEILDVGTRALVGASPDAFNFVPGATPLSTWPTTLALTATYFAVIFGGQYLMKDRPAIRPQRLFFAHNAILSAFSLFLLGCFLEILVPRLLSRGVFWSICNPGALTSRLEWLYYLNYLTKYYELVDTVFLVIKKKKLEFLHVYHHSMTMVLCFIELEGKAPVQWVVIVLNLMVHVIMYYYYAVTAISSKPIWWKKHLTTMQITQFVIDIAVIYFATFTLYTHKYAPALSFGSCQGSEFSAAFGCALISSYLLLFIQFFIKTYKSRSRAHKTASTRSAGSSPKSKRSVVDKATAVVDKATAVANKATAVVKTALAGRGSDSESERAPRPASKSPARSRSPSAGRKAPVAKRAATPGKAKPKAPRTPAARKSRAGKAAPVDDDDDEDVSTSASASAGASRKASPARSTSRSPSRSRSITRVKKEAAVVDAPVDSPTLRTRRKK